MSRNHETRLLKLEGQHAEVRETHEERLDRMAHLPPLTATEIEEMDSEITTEAVAEFGSLAAAALAVRTNAKRTSDPYDDLRAGHLEYLVEKQSERWLV